MLLRLQRSLHHLPLLSLKDLLVLGSLKELPEVFLLRHTPMSKKELIHYEAQRTDIEPLTIVLISRTQSWWELIQMLLA